MDPITFINQSIEENGATHILNVKINSDSNIDNRHDIVKNFIDNGRDHIMYLGSSKYCVRWISGNIDDISSIYFYTVFDKLNDIILLAHTKQMILSCIRDYYLRNDLTFKGCEFIYSVTKTTMLANRIKVDEFR